MYVSVYINNIERNMASHLFVIYIIMILHPEVFIVRLLWFWFVLFRSVDIITACKY